MKKIAVIVSYKFTPAESGGQKYILHFLHHISDVFDAYVFGTANNESQKESGFKSINYLLRNPCSYIDIVGFLKIYSFIKREKIGTLIIEHPYIGWMGILLKYLLNIRLIIHTHNVEYIRFKTIHKWWWPILKIYERWVLSKADQVFCITDEDREYMANNLSIDPLKCNIVPFGIQQESTPEDKTYYKDIICNSHSFDNSKPLVLFNGLLDYKPNEEAVEYIVDEIIPRLNKSNFEYNLMIAGKNLSPLLTNKITSLKNVVYTGFIKNIDDYVKAADIFINPVISGGGVKTKLIEALGMNCTCISTDSGALGVVKDVCGEKLIIVEDKNWDGFAKAIITASKSEYNIPDTFYKKYNWGSIVSEVKNYI
jgi:glycosyltransferase involved in cell wall biosynthesis